MCLPGCRCNTRSHRDQQDAGKCSRGEKSAAYQLLQQSMYCTYGLISMMYLAASVTHLVWMATSVDGQLTLKKKTGEGKDFEKQMCDYQTMALEVSLLGRVCMACKHISASLLNLSGFHQALKADLAHMGASSADLIWATSLAHSRSFAVGGPGDVVTHIIAPGIDLANHSWTPNASVRQVRETTLGFEQIHYRGKSASLG